MTSRDLNMPGPYGPQVPLVRGFGTRRSDVGRTAEGRTAVKLRVLMFTPRRIESHELLDEHDAPTADMERSLRDLRRINKYLGGIAIYRRLLRRFTPRSVLDLGTGTSDDLEAVPHVPLRIGLDFKIDHLLYMRNGSRVLRVVGDATRLPFRDGAVDVVTSAPFFHHFSPDGNVTIPEEPIRVPR